jgi:AsmA-like protein
VLRLLRGRDCGLRGDWTLHLAAHSEDPHWSVVASAQFRRIHGWNLPLRADNPAFNVNVSATWQPELSRVDVLQALIEAPRSNLRAAGYFSWARPPGAPHGPEKDSRLALLSTGIRLDDLLAWYRAFEPNVAQELAMAGRVGVDVKLAGWPPHIEKGELVAAGTRLEGGSLPEPLHFSRGVLRFDRKGAKLDPVMLTIGRDAGAIRIEAAARSAPEWQWNIKAGGQAEKVGDLIDTAAALGRPLPHGWDMEGPARFELEWQHATNPFRTAPLGKIELNGLAMHAPFLNRPINQITALVDLRADGLRVKLDAAQAFGAHWSGSLERRNGEEAWGFSLAADRLGAPELDRWLNPQWGEGLLERVLPILRPSANAELFPAGFEARGQLRVDSFSLAPLELRRVHAEASLQGRRLQLADAEADFYGGTLRGAMRADLTAEPAYRVEAKLAGVSVAALSDATTNFKGRFAGTASGEIELDTHGLGRAGLIGALNGHGAIEVRNAELHGLDLLASLRGASRQPGASAFPLAASQFTVSDGKVQFSNLRLEGAENGLEATGSVDPSGSFDLQFSAVTPADRKKVSAVRDAPPVPKGAFRVTGQLENLQIVRRSGPAPEP